MKILIEKDLWAELTIITNDRCYKILFIRGHLRFHADFDPANLQSVRLATSSLSDIQFNTDRDEKYSIEYIYTTWYYAKLIVIRHYFITKVKSFRYRPTSYKS